MSCTEIEFHFSDRERIEILSAILGANDFTGFEETGQSFNAYTDRILDEATVRSMLKEYTIFDQVNFKIRTVPYKNWNAIWEQNYKPIFISNRVFVRSSFHKPNQHAEYEIIIDPKMAFGTGHHDTTSMMMEMMLHLDLRDKTVLDFGSGTGILSILAEKMGAANVIALDNDQRACENMMENIQLNHADNIMSIQGNEHDIPCLRYDLVLANVNKNIIVNCMEILACNAKLNAQILLCGLLTKDEKVVLEAASQFGLSPEESKTRNEWICLKLNKVSR